MSYRSAADRLNNFDIKHLNNIADHIARINLITVTPFTDRYSAINWLRRNADNYMINTAHDAVTARYKSGERIHVKGRPPGSRNKNSRANSDGSTTVELPDLDDVFGDENNSADNSAKSGDDSRVNMDEKQLAAAITQIVQQALEPFEETNAKEHNALRDIAASLHNGLSNLQSKIANIVDNRPTIIELKKPELPELKNIGVQHKQFAKLLKMISARNRGGNHLNIWIHGPAGTGKSTAAEKVAEALGMNFYTNGALNAPHEVLGFNNAHSYVTTAFRQAWEFGGVYCFDEIDASNPAAILALNGALAGSICSFPDKMVRRHPDCVVIATANTIGHGASAEYSGRYKQDAAAMDRFVLLDWPIDEALERAMCGNDDWCNTVQLYRRKLAKLSAGGNSSIKSFMITPRATLNGEALIAAGFTVDEAIEACIKKGIPDAQWQMIENQIV